MEKRTSAGYEETWGDGTERHYRCDQPSVRGGDHCHGCGTAPDVCSPVYGDHREKEDHHVRRIGNDGIRIPRRDRRQTRQSGYPGDRDLRRRRYADEHSGVCDRSAGRTSACVMCAEQYLSWDGAAVAEAVLRKTLRYDEPQIRRTVSTDQWGGDAGVHAGFCEAGRELRGERNPCDEAGRDRTGI